MFRILCLTALLAVPFVFMTAAAPVQAQQLPGYGLLPQDGQIVAVIGQRCGGNPYCMASAWGTVEVQRCRNGFFVQGGCFGPNGEIVRAANYFLPQNLRPQTVINNVQHDIQHGPGENNDLVGCNGALSKLFGGGC
jgi:hypothetical protein